VVNSRVTGQLWEMQVKGEFSDARLNYKTIAYFGPAPLLLAQDAVEIGLEMRLQ
jgi:hypothetical protein